MKRALALILTVICTMAVLSACSLEDITEQFSGQEEETEQDDTQEPVDVTAKDMYAIVTQKANEPYSEIIVRSFKTVCTETEKECIVCEPAAGLASEQIEFVQDLIDKQVSAIAISPVDPKALQSVLKKAMKAGIHVCSFDTPAKPESRELHVSGSDNENISVTLMDAVLDLTGGEGEWAVMATRAASYNQSEWIKAMKALCEDDEKYQTLTYTQTAYCEDDYQKAYDQTKSILSMSPDVRVIVALSTVGMKGAAQAVTDSESFALVTGIGLPSKMNDYIGSNKACPYMYMWSPTTLGRVTAYVAIGLGTGKLTGEAEEQFRIGDEEVYQVTSSEDEGTEVIVDYPRHYDSGNIADLADDA